METDFCNFSVVIPVGSGELAQQELLRDLSRLPGLEEIIRVEEKRGRAFQMNLGARRATRRFLWFLHADSRIDPREARALLGSVSLAPEALHYFDLRFAEDGPRLTALNAWGARLRSRYLQLPFGDQGFCLARSVFLELGGYDETVPYGEDHLLVWAARRRGIPIRCAGGSLVTSARRYRDQGWMATTAKHLFRTARQALPEWIRMRQDGPRSR